MKITGWTTMKPAAQPLDLKKRTPFAMRVSVTGVVYKLVLAVLIDLRRGGPIYMIFGTLVES